MTTYYVGIGGADGNNGQTWANRKLTLNGAEDIPVVANDTVYVGPGVYREKLTVDVNGSSGQPITYIADVTGEHTDGVGGIVRITGSDDDLDSDRDNCITGSSKDYRTFRGFAFDTTSSYIISMTNNDSWIIEDCFFGQADAAYGIGQFTTGTSCTIRRCVFLGQRYYPILVSDSSEHDNSGHLIENCLLFSASECIRIDRVGGITVRNCTFLSGSRAVRVWTALSNGQTTTVNNCIISGCSTTGLQAVTDPGVNEEITEDYNTFFNNSADRSNVSAGGNSVAYPPLFISPILHAGVSQVSGFKFPWWFGELSEWSPIATITGSNEPTEDLLGIVRPTTAAKNSWGAFQFHNAERETTTTRGGSDASIIFNDAGSHQIWVPVDGTQITVSVYCYREADYAGTNPRMVIKQPGQSDRTTTDAAAASQWNELTDTFTPSSTPPYIVVELQSLNTNTANAATNDCFFDDLTVT